MGELIARKRYRMSGIVVLIGYLLLIPSIFGIAFCVLMLFATGGATSRTLNQLKEETRQKLVNASVPSTTIEHVLSSQPLSEAERQSLTPDQARAVDDAKLSMSAGMAGVGLGGVFAGGASVCVGIASLIGGLLGWLLVMKKKVLQCNRCSAVIAAS